MRGPGLAASLSRYLIDRITATKNCGVFAVGDVRSGSVKRVGGAIGEGAAVVALVHQYLATLAKPASSP